MGGLRIVVGAILGSLAVFGSVSVASAAERWELWAPPEGTGASPPPIDRWVIVPDDTPSSTLDDCKGLAAAMALVALATDSEDMRLRSLAAFCMNSATREVVSLEVAPQHGDWQLWVPPLGTAANPPPYDQWQLQDDENQSVQSCRDTAFAHGLIAGAQGDNELMERVGVGICYNRVTREIVKAFED